MSESTNHGQEQGAMGWPEYDRVAAVELIRDANATRERSSNETVIREALIKNLADTFPRNTRPWWIERHIRGAEAHLKFLKDGEVVRGYADSVVGLTAIEYEADLRDAERFTEGKNQVRQYCAGLLNTGADPSKVRGVLSDTVEWRAYRVKDTPEKQPGRYDVADIDLEEIESLVCSIADEDGAEALVCFLTRHLGREGTRPLTGPSVVDYLGFNSGFGHAHLEEFGRTIRAAMTADAPAAALVEKIWTSFVSYLNADGSTMFSVDTYVQEFYVSTLAKLLCVNVIERRALRSNDAELESILDGRFFRAKGLHRLVEHDYFGWLAQPDRVADIRNLARSLQADLAAYDFDTPPSKDVFGELIAMLAERTQRILLGQEWTPSWLAARMARWMFDALPEGEPPRFVDMCCGSGSMLVETTRHVRERLAAANVDPGSQEYIDFLVRSATGFDIDPLAVILAKVNWVVTNRDALGPLNGSCSIFVPVYHADSLFALAPVFDDPDHATDPNSDYRLHLLDHTIDLPRFLIQPDKQLVFDGLLDRAHSLAMSLAVGLARPPDEALIDQIVSDVLAETDTNLDDDELNAVTTFVAKFVEALEDLQRSDENGVWVFIVRNSYRPGLVAGQFNGIISNPPWLALSKIANNPFGPVLRQKADQYGLVPSGSAFLHLEMATVFLAHAVDHYLADGGLVACVLPDTARNGSQHLPFRSQVCRYEDTEPRIQLRLDELWMIEPGVFKNRAIIAVGRKAEPEAVVQIEGKVLGAERMEDMTHYVAAAGNRMVWSPNPPGEGVPGGYPTGFFSQGADVMPRRLVFFDTQAASGNRVTVRPIERDSAKWFLVSNAKKHDEFEVTPRTIPDRFAHSCLLSAHVGPFAVATASCAVLPILPTDNHAWRLATDQEIAGAPTARDHFREIVGESDFDSVQRFWNDGLDCRRKSSRQAMPPGGWLVVYGAGGGIPAAAHKHIESDNDRVLVDQTLYWTLVGDEEHALYLCGLINSNALLRRIADFIPEGEFGDRHLHTLPAKAIPQYDPADASHTEVVNATRALVEDLEARRQSDPDVATLFTTAIDMRRRRQRLRDVIAALPSNQRFEKACSSLYEALA